MLSYNDFNIGESTRIGAVNVTIWQDDLNENPWEAWEGNPPLLASYDRSITEYDESGEIERPLDFPSNGWISYHFKTIVDLLDLDYMEAESDCRDEKENWPRCTMSDIRREYLQDALQGARPSRSFRNAGDYFETLAQLWQMQGVKALATSVIGYCQGDYTDLLLVMTPGFCKKHGIKKPNDEGLESSAALYGAWAFGDVYGYTIESDDESIHESCGGFYGSPWGNNPASGDSWHVLDGIQESLGWVKAEHVKSLKKRLQGTRVKFLNLMRESRFISPSNSPDTWTIARQCLKGLARDWCTLKNDLKAWEGVANG